MQHTFIRESRRIYREVSVSSDSESGLITGKRFAIFAPSVSGRWVTADHLAFQSFRSTNDN